MFSTLVSTRRTTVNHPSMKIVGNTVNVSTASSDGDEPANPMATSPPDSVDR
jgi:hypothetical protein